MKLLATILSTIFHPLLMPTYGIAIALYTSYMRVFGDRLLGIIVIGVLLTTCILPSLGIFILYKTGHISDFQTSQPHRAYRSVYHQLCLLYRMLSLLIPFRDTGWILSFIAGAIVSLIISLFINRYWKISAHMVAAGAMAVLVFLMSIYRLMLTPYIFPLQITIILLAGLIGSSRILLNRHTIGQVGAGFALGAMCCGFLFFLFI